MLTFSPTAIDRQKLEQETQDRQAAASPVSTTGKRQNAFDVLTGENQIDKDEVKKLNKSQIDFLRELEAIKQANGDIAIFNKGSSAPSSFIDKNGGVHINMDSPVDSQEHIEALLKGAETFKALHPGEQSYNYSKNGELGRIMMDYTGRLAGVETANPPDKRLEDMPEHAELVKKINEAWKKMGGADLNPPQPASTFSPAAIPGADPNPDKTQVTVTYREEYSATGTLMGLSFDKETLANSKLAQFLNGKDLSNYHDLGKEVDKLKNEGYEFTDHDRLLIKSLQSAIEPATNYPNYGPGPVGRDFSEDDLRVDNARKNWHNLEEISKTIGNPPDPNADTVPHFSKSEILKALRPERPDINPDAFKILNEMSDPDYKPEPLNPEMEQKINELIKESENKNLSDLNEQFPKIIAANSPSDRAGITDTSRSGLTSPVQGGLSCKFDGCATGTDPSGDPARQKQLDADLEQKRPTPAPLGMSNTA